jgi:hypothetical protein
MIGRHPRWLPYMVLIQIVRTEQRARAKIGVRQLPERDEHRQTRTHTHAKAIWHGHTRLRQLSNGFCSLCLHAHKSSLAKASAHEIVLSTRSAPPIELALNHATACSTTLHVVPFHPQLIRCESYNLDIWLTT